MLFQHSQPIPQEQQMKDALLNIKLLKMDQILTLKLNLVK